MKSAVLWSLIVLNAALLLWLAGRVWPGNIAVAQQAAARRPGDYVAIPADISGLSNGIVVIVDQINGELSAVSYDDSARRLVSMPKINLVQVFERGTGGRNVGR